MRRTLLALSCTVLLACPGDDSSSTTNSMADSGTAGSGTGATTSGTDTGTMTGSATEVASGEGTTGGPSTAPGEGSVSGTGTGPDPLGVCMTSCEHLADCGLVRVPNCGIPCATIESDVAGCESEYIAQQECVIGLTCEEATVWLEGDMLGGDYPCSDEDVAFQACVQG